MSSTPGDARDAGGPSRRQCLLPSVAHTPSVTEVAPAKKITFLKQGDPRFAGVRLAVHQRSFKTFSALMDELSQRVPLSFGVRSVTTPRGLHSLTALEQLQDGGCYLCSDKKLPKTPREPDRPLGRSPSAVQSVGVEDGHEMPGTSSWKGPTTQRRVTLVKNRDPRCQQTVVLSHRNTRNLTAFLRKASDLLHFPVKQVYTTSGKKVDSLQTLLHSPAVLVCAGNEAFRRPVMENSEGNRMGTLSGLTDRSKSGVWGPKAKQSVIHSRSRAGGRLQQFSLLSERSGLGDHLAPGHHDWVGSAMHNCPQDSPAPPGTLMVGDGVEKKVCMNEDGSLSVEMKVRFQLLGEDALRWSQRVGRAGVLTAASEESQVLEKAHPFCYRQEGHPRAFLEPKAQGLSACEVGCPGALDGDQRSASSFNIWRNPLATSQGEGPSPRRRWGLTQLSHSRARWSQRFNDRKRHDNDSVNLASSPVHPESTQVGSHCLWPSEGGVGSNSLCPSAVSQSGAEPESGKGLCPEDTRPGVWVQCQYLGPGIQVTERALSDTSTRAGFHEESREWGGEYQSCLNQARAVASQGEVTQVDSSHVLILGPSSLSHMDLQSEKHEQDTRSCKARGVPGQRLPLAAGLSSSCDAAVAALPNLTTTPAQKGKRRQKRPASAVCIPVHQHVAQRGHGRQCHHCRNTLCSLGSLTTLQSPRPPERRTHSGGLDAQLPQNSCNTRTQASKDPRSLSSSSLSSQDPPAASRATIPPMSSSERASSFYCSSTSSAEPAGDTEHRAHSSTPTLAYTDGASGLKDKAGGSSEPPSSSALLDGHSEAGGPGAHQGCHCSQIVASSIFGNPSGQTEAHSSKDCWVHNSYCPTNSRELPCAKKHPSSSSSTSSGQQGVDDNARPRRFLPRKSPEYRKSLEDQEEDGGMTPSALPSTSPDAVVRDWLGNIPEEPVLMAYELLGETTEGVSDETKDPEDNPGVDCSLKGLGELGQSGQQLPEGDTDVPSEPVEVLPVTGDVLPKSGEGSHQDAALSDVSKDPTEAKVRERTTMGPGISPRVLPNRVSASTQLMKALLGSKQGRPSSLPEVSSTAKQRLSHSARDLIACLARLHFFDEALGPLAGKARIEDSPRYQELLSIIQALWPRSGLGQGQLNLDLGRLTSHQPLPGSENFTPTSSSGVDVSSGSRGSGEGSVPCAVDSILVPQRMELPLNISQRSDSKTHGHPEMPSCSPDSSSSQVWAGTSHREEAERGGREEMLGSILEHSGTVQEEEVWLEETEGIGKERAQEEGVKEESLPERVEVGSQGLLEEGSQDGAGSPEDTGVLEEETGRDAAGLYHPGQREDPAEPPYHLSNRNTNATEHKSGPKLEPRLEELTRAAVMGRETQAKTNPITGETSTFMTHEVSLNPDPIWVSKLLKKMEKAFMSHLASTIAELRARWNLQNNGLLDQMVAELEQDVGLRLQASTDKELRKIQSRAGRTVLGPPQEALRGQTSLQTEHRRRRLQGLRNFSAFPDLGTLSLTLEDGPILSSALGTRPGGGTTEDEFCPCEACVRKKLAYTSSKDVTTVANSAPIRKAFDLRQILQNKKGGRGDGEAAGVVPENIGMIQPQEDLGTVHGADEVQELQQAPGAVEVQQGKGSQRPSREEDPGLREAGGAGYHKSEDEKEGPTQPWAAHTLQAKEGTLSQGSEDGNALESAARQSGSSHSVENQEATGEGQSEEKGDNQSEKENAPQVGLGEIPMGEASTNSSLDQEGKPCSSHQRPGPQTHRAACSLSNASSLSNCSLVSQKSSEKDCPSRVPKNTKVGVSGQEERRVVTMYPESSTSEQEGSPSNPRSLEQGTGEGCGVGGERTVGRFAFIQTEVRADGFDQDDLDF